MTGMPFTATADVNGNATVTIPPVKSGLQWTIAQTSVESFPSRVGASCVASLNGNLVTSTQIIPSAASGPPAFNIQAGDQLAFTFSGLTQGDVAKVTLYYNESAWGTPPNYSWV